MKGLIAGWLDPRSLDHQNDGSLVSPCSMQYALRNGESLPWRELYTPAIQIDQKASFNNVEKLIFIVVLVPVKLTLQNAEPHNAIVYSAQCLIVPGVFARINKRLNIDQLQRGKTRIQVDRVGFFSPHSDLFQSQSLFYKTMDQQGA